MITLLMCFVFQKTALIHREQLDEVTGVTDWSLSKENLLAIDQILKLDIDDWSANYLDAYAPAERS
jgi:hypothetical protein